MAEGGKERRVPADGSPDLIASSKIRPGHGIPSLTMVAVEKSGKKSANVRPSTVVGGPIPKAVL